jgi:ATP-binding cassette subfamily C (CFTR/MRP) protein 1
MRLLKEEDELELQADSSNAESDEIELESLLPKTNPKRLPKHDWVEENIAEFSVVNINDPGNNLIQIEKGHFSFTTGGVSILDQISLTAGRGELLLLTGPTGSGKSSLLLAMLGELHQSRGSTYRMPSLGIAFCAQEPWLPSVSIRDAIIGPSILDQVWLAEVIAACDLGQDISSLPEKEHSLVGSNGARLSGGQKQRLSLARALYSRKKALLLDDVFSGLDLSTERIVAQNVLGPDGLCRRHGLTVLMTALTPRHVKYFDKHYVLQAGGTLSRSMLEKSSLLTRENWSGDKQEQARKISQNSFSDNQDSSPEIRNISAPAQTTTGTGLDLYKYFFSKMGWGSISMVFAASATFVFCFKFPDVWLKWWTESESRDSDSNGGMYMAVYILLAVVALLALVSFSWSLKIIAVPRTAASLHQALLSTVVSAPYYFLVATGPGSIVNRFSEDLSVIDLQLTLALAKSIDGFFTIVAEASLVAFASPLTVLAFPPLIVVLWILQKIYLRTSRQIRLLEIEARAPLYSHFLETLAGLVTIRAFAWQRHWVQRQRDALDRSQRALYMTYCTQRWLNLVLDLIVAGVGVTVMALVTQLPSQATDGGALGVSLTNIVTFSATLTYVIQGWAQLETSMGAVQRVRDFTEQTPSENKSGESRVLPLGWAISRAGVRFDGVTAAYRQVKSLESKESSLIVNSNSSNTVLKDATFQITPGQKVGVCGRTGR